MAKTPKKPAPKKCGAKKAAPKKAAKQAAKKNVKRLAEANPDTTVREKVD